MLITGNLVNAFFICRRKFWLYARQFNPDPENDLLLLGRLISERSFSREKKELSFDGIKIDLMKKSDKGLLICEIKKSSKGIEAAKMQLAFYLSKLKKHGINVEGEILIPKEKKRITLNLDENIENLLQAAIENMEEIAQKTSPPPVIRNSFCRKCAFIEFCYA
ncbi:MAG: CRISPR-associated protein Cas4 [Deferribacterales bacterium]|nr:CRISPR-associated protein Cas4 [Deferribacterales bacterium]